ncbi:FAD-binding oxidoreductase [Phenylobacterium sp.]|uniref:FAD-binding oxidoreductase n=1 Tax=Phenylobacterium sp. TaxID=1871053 RepID=UPI0025EC9B9D|nr:FAD-binding oxidoreductase [Phenylobacterium sp.]
MALKRKSALNAAEPDIVAALTAVAGAEALRTSEAERTFFSTDIAGRGETADAVVRVSDTDTLAQVVATATRMGWIVVPRGGGFSYTGGYTPETRRSVIVDLRGLDRVVEINARDMYVVVEAGCTWQNLYERLRAAGFRTPYFGPMSGANATVGGALSQGSFFLGSNQYGSLADSVLALEIVLADGTVMRTGSWGSSEGAAPFFRQYGPDLTGLFLNDTGAMGFKSRAVLRLIPFPTHQAYASFAFTTHQAALAAVSAIGRTGLAAECYCWDPFFVRLMAANASTGLREDLSLLLNVVKGGSNLLDGLIGAVRIAMAGRAVFRGDTWLMHLAIDDVSAAGAAEKLKLLRAIAGKAGGREVAPTAPRTLRGTPFTDFNTAERRLPRRSLPVHGVCSHSAAAQVADEVYACLAANRTEMERLGVNCGTIFLAVGGQAVTVEPLLSWDDAEHFLHNRVEETSDLAALATYDDRPEATRLAFELRQAFKAIFRRHGCAHVQIGRAYPWAETRDPAVLRLIEGFKDAVDPRRVVNRGSLGFGGPAH